MHGMTRSEGMRSMVHSVSASGCMETQLSRATPAYGVDPPQISTFRGSEYGAYWGIRTAVPSSGYVRPPRKLSTAPGMLGSCFVVANVFSSKILASL